MPIRSDMTWEAKKNRWRKMHKGKLYTVSCSTLGCPATKEGSYQAANAWWKAKEAELTGEATPHAGLLQVFEQRLAWSQNHGQQDEATRASEAIDALKGDTERSLEGWHLRALVGTDEQRAVWQDRLVREQNLTPHEGTIASHVARYLELEKGRMQAGNLSASEYDTTRRCVGILRDFIGGSNLPGAITADTWESYWLHLLNELAEKRKSREYCVKAFRHGRTFVRWLAGKGVIALPLNLHERKHRFGADVRKLPTIDVAEIRKAVDAAPGQLKLHLLLMLNCGMLQKDISDLRQDEVDWKAGRIARKRGKTSHHAGVPTVSYKLWPITFELLKQHRSNDPEIALLTRQGKRWIEEWFDKDGTLKGRDGIVSNFAHVRKRLKLNWSLKVVRKTSASMLDRHESYGRFSPHFLGHAPRSVAERHYVTPSQEQFDAAVLWLGKQYGLA